MSDNGWICLYRQLGSHKLWLREPFTRGQAWVDLLMLAAWKDTGFFKRGVWVEQRRGQVAMSVVGLADRWRWSRGKTIRFLNWLKSEHQIEHQTNNVTTVITIVNYNDYQPTVHQTEQQTGSRRAADGQQTDTIEEVKKVEEGQKGKKKRGFLVLFSGSSGEADGREMIPVPPVLDNERFSAAWSDWETHRAEKKNKLTGTAVQMQLKTLAKMGLDAAIRTIEHTIERGWIGLRQPEPNSDSRGPRKLTAKDLEF